MLAGYPAFWNHDYYDWNIKSNSNYALYITEVSRVSDEIYKVEMINTETRECNCSFHLGGRFKFFLKKGDTFDFQYYYNTQYDYSVRATVETLAYNTLELSFDKAICLPPDFDK